MAKKNTPALFGYTDQPTEYQLANGNTLPAGDLVDRAAARYHADNPGLDAHQVPLAWNDLDEAERYRYCLAELDAANAAAEEAGKHADAAAVLESATAPEAAKHLGAALIDAALTEVKALARPWQQMTEDQQDEVLERITRQVREAVGETIRMLATHNAPHLVCELEAITIKKGAKATLAIPKGELDQDVLDAVGQQVILVIGPELKAAADIPQPKADPNQRDLLDGAGLGNGDPGTVQHSDPED